MHDRATTAGLRVSHYYGSAELSFVAWGTHEDDLRPFPGAVVEIRSGVIWVRSPYLCRTLEGDGGALETDDEGFATVGDRGQLVDGRLVVEGRGDTVVTTGGTTVLVADVEAVLREVADVAVVGVPHQRLGEVVAAVVTDGSAFRRLREHARAHLPREQQPRQWFEVREAPSTEAGKLDRSSLRSLVARGGPGIRRLT